MVKDGGFVIDRHVPLSTGQQSAVTASRLNSLDSILVLQGGGAGFTSPEQQRRRKALMHGADMLDLLSEMKSALLMDHEKMQRTVERLRHALKTSDMSQGLQDPELNQIIKDIDLRARVEIAKLEFEDG